MTKIDWPKITDEGLVERLIPAVQQAIANVCSDGAPGGHPTPTSGPDVANVLLMILATVLEPSPACATPHGLRLLGEAAGKELTELIHDTKQLTNADKIGGGLH